MDFPENLRLDIIHKIKGHHNEAEFSSSDSDTENSATTSRSITSETSSILASPRASLLWDHGYDVAEAASEKFVEHRENEWKKFNITDDDKLSADWRSSKLRETHGSETSHVRELEKRDDIKKQNANEYDTGQNHLPDLLAFTASSINKNCSTRQQLDDFDEIAPPLPDSEPPALGEADTPPPLPSTSPPSLSETLPNEEQLVSSIVEGYPQNENQSCCQDSNSESILINTEDSGGTKIDGIFEDLLCFETETHSASPNFESPRDKEALGDNSNEMNCNKACNNSDTTCSSDDDEQENDIEQEFDAILHAFDLHFGQDTYVERFSERRDRYGFILSPIVEAPSPTPSSLSGYSGISSASPDPFSVFRMSPAPRGIRVDMDLSSLGVYKGEFEEPEQTVPIYQNATAKKAIVIPEGYGWESGDDLLSPTGSAEWDLYENGLSSPPVSASSINLLQFGKHIAGWKQPQAIIPEETEADIDSDSTFDGEHNSNSDTDSTVEGEDTANYSGELNHSENNEYSHIDTNPRIDSSESVINTDLHLHIYDSLRSLDSLKLNKISPSHSSQSNVELESLDSQQSNTDSDSSSETSGDEDAEDEYSDSESENEHDPVVSKCEDQTHIESVSDSESSDLDVHVKEIISPRIAKLLSGGMYPEDSDSSYDTDDVENDELEHDSNMSSYGSGVLVTNYTSGDSDDSHTKASKDVSKCTRDLKETGLITGLSAEEKRNKSRVIIHSPIDFSFLGPHLSLPPESISSFESESPRTEEKRSPRVFGRYYEELEKGIIERASKRNIKIETLSGETDMKHTYTANFYSTLSPEEKTWNEIKDSFKDIEIKAQTDQHNEVAQNISDNKNKQSLGNEQNKTHEPVNDLGKETEVAKKAGVSDNIAIIGPQTVNDYKSKISVNERVDHKKHVDGHKPAVSTQNTMSQQKEKRKKISNTTPVKISVSHLSRKGSFNDKIKSGYVHQLSELFKQKDEGNKPAVVLTELVKRTEDPAPKPISPKMILAKDNIIVTNRSSPINTPTIQDAVALNNESLGFEVTRFENVDSFDDNVSDFADDDSDLVLDNYEDDFESDSSSSCSPDGDLESYENVLRQIESDSQGAHVQQEETTCMTKVTSIVNSESEMEISEHIEGSVKSESSDDEELFRQIHAYDSLRKKYKDHIDVTQRQEQTSDNQAMDVNVTNASEFKSNHTQTRHLMDESFSSETKQPQSQTSPAVSLIRPRESDESRSRTVHAVCNALFEKEEHKINGVNSSNKSETVRDSSRISADLGNIFWSSKLLDYKGPNYEIEEKGQASCRSSCEGAVKTSGSLYNIFRRIDQVKDRTNDLHERNSANIEISAENEPMAEHFNNQEKGESIKSKDRDNFEHVSQENTETGLKKDLAKILTPTENIVIFENEDLHILPNSSADMTVRATQSLPCDNLPLYEQAMKSSITNDLLAENAHQNNPRSSLHYSEPATYSQSFGTAINSNTPQDNAFALNPNKHIDSDHFRYPSSLSKRLYGPYCRVRNIRSHSWARETTPQVLSPNSEENVMPHNSANQTRVLHSECNEPHTLPKRKRDLLKIKTALNIPDEYKAFEYAEGDARNSYFDIKQKFDLKRENSSLDNLEFETTGQSIDNIDGRIIYPDAFEHSCYDVKTPVLSTNQREGIKPRSSPITYCNVTEAQRESRSKVSFSNSNHRSASSLEAVNTDARKDKQEFDFFKVPRCSNTEQSTSLTVNTQSNAYSCDYADERFSVHADIKEGGFTRQTAVKNDSFHENLGVCMPRETTSTNATHQNGTMKNDMQSNETKLSNATVVLPGINGFSSGQTASICQPHMSEGDVFTYNDKDPDKTLLRACRSKTTATVLIQTQDCQHVLEDEKGNLNVWPYSDFENSRRHPVTLHRAKKGIKLFVRKAGMSHANSNMTVIQSAQHSTEMPENRMTEKYHSSSVLPVDNGVEQLMQTHGESVQNVLFKDTNGNTLTEEEFSAILPKIADSISKMKDVNAEEILPGITQSVTKLQNGGNLVITTMTRKLDEVESDESGRGSPEPPHPVLNVDDLENSKIYLVQDSKGEMFYVEDITNESHESAYFSSRNTSDSISDGGYSPTFQNISKIHEVGKGGIQNKKAEEIISAMYGNNDMKEITENEEEWSERTYEYDIPRARTANPRQGYSKETFNSSYMVEEPDTLPRAKTKSQDRLESSYEVSGTMPWVYDGGISQSYSQATHAAEDVDSASAISGTAAGGITKTTERLTVEAETEIYPLVPVMATPPAPVFVPPLAVQTDTPQYSLVKVDVAPKQEIVSTKVDVTERSKTVEVDDRPIYKTVAHIQTREKQPPVKSEMAEPKRYRIITSKATSADQEEQETRMSLDEVDYKYTAENVEYKMSPSVKTTQYYVRNTTDLDSPKRYRTERKLEINNSSDQKHRTEIQVQDTKKDVVEENSFYSYDAMKTEMEQTDSSMRVVRGSYLIKNNLEEVDESLDDNLNMFDGNFTLRKDNPLYQSDEDLYRRYEREKQELAQKQEHFQRNVNQDISFETLDRFSKSKTVQREERPKQSLSELLLSRLSTVDSKDIHQRIDVKHHSEDIYGDPRFLHADGTNSTQGPSGSSAFDSVGEKVDLLLKDGKAYITVKVTAEKIVPLDMEFNVWRKNQAIVTRIIEVDLLATEQRRRLYYKVMQEPAGVSRGSHRAGPNETILDSKQTLELFTKILGAADGEGDKEDITVRTRSGRTTRPFTSGMDLMY